MDPATKHNTGDSISQGELTIIDASAGSGKTTAIVQAMSGLAFEWSMAPERMLALTFNKAMALELKSRCADAGLDGVNASTVHAFCLRLVMEDPQRFGFTSNPDVLKREDSYLQRQYRNYFGSSPPIRPRLIVRAFHARYQRGIRVHAFLRDKKVSDAKIDRVIKFFKHYAATKRRENKLGFHDMVALVRRRLKADPDFRASLGRRYRFLAVDEYQDLSAQDRALVQLLAEQIETVLIVGDALQSINTFRGASTTALQELKAEFPDARVIPLDRSWRLTQENAAFVNRVLKHNGYDKRIIGTGHGPKPQVIAANSRNRMYQRAAQVISGLITQGVEPEEIAVLARFSKSFQTFGRYLHRHDVPFTLSSHGDTRHKLLLRFRCFLRAVLGVENPKTLQVLLQREAQLDEDTAAQLTDLDGRIPAQQLGLSPEQQKRVRKVRDAVKQTRAKPTIDRALHVFAAAFQGRQDRFYLTPIQHVLRLDGIQFDQQATLTKLHNRVNRRIKQLKKAKGSKASTPPNEGVTLSTTHAAKGREWPHVLVLDLYDENLSRNGELAVDKAAEFNVFHVALTRAKQQTHLFLLKHEAAVDAVTINKGDAADVLNLKAIAKYQYHTLRFLPPNKHVKTLCTYHRTDRIKLDQNDTAKQRKKVDKARQRASQ
jgi:DNA helicase-2/ATP-dependent DNA helicase PcrA